MKTNQLVWLDWVEKLRSIAQIGKAFTRDPYDMERYEQLTELAHQMYAKLGEVPVSRIEQLFLPEQGYCTPKVELRAGVFVAHKVLLVRERAEQKWSLPGGWADIQESPAQGVVREVWEESGYRVRNPELVAVVDRSLHEYQPRLPYHVYKLFFLCEFVEGKPSLNIEVDAIDFFAMDQLPELSLGRVLKQDIARLYQAQYGERKSVFVD